MQTWHPTILGQIRKPLEPDIPKQDRDATAFPFYNYSLLVAHLISYPFWNTVIMLLPASDQVSVTADQPQLLCAAAPLRHRLAIPLFQGPSPAHGASVVIWQSQNKLFHQRQSGPSPGCCWASFACCKQTPFGETEASQHLAGNAQENFSSAVCLWNSGVLKSWKIYTKITN